MSIDANSASDHTIASFVTGYNENESFDNNGCSWLEIGNVEQSNYNGHDYKFINLIPAIGDAIQINFSQFIYPMSRYRREADKLPSLIEMRPHVVVQLMVMRYRPGRSSAHIREKGCYIYVVFMALRLLIV